MPILDLRDHPGFAIAAANGIIAARDFFYDPSKMTLPYRGYRKPNMFARVRNYNAARLASFNSRPQRLGRAVRPVRSRTYVPKPVSTYRRRVSRKKSPTVKNDKTFSITQKTLIGGTVTEGALPGICVDTADHLYGEWFCDYLDSATDSMVPLNHFGGSTNLIYGRLRVPISKFIASGGMASQFTKFRVNKITITWNFPDQAASTTNDEYPLVFFVNHGDKWRTDIDSYGEDAAWTTSTQLLNRPGWKRYNAKRMTKLSVSFTPTVSKTREFQTAANVDVDQRKMVSHGFVDLDADGTSSVALYGPTIAIQFPSKTTYAAGDWNDFFTSGHGAECTYLTHGTIAITANCTYKSPDNDAVLLNV